jgi:tRNA(fMet)-specific endonuclease VapC
MLDTSTVSHLVKQQTEVVRRVISVPMSSLCLSAITEGELLFGLAKRPSAARLHRSVRELLRRIDVLPWDSATAARYGVECAQMVQDGRTLAPLDLLIAAHALSVGAVLVTGDQVFAGVPDLIVEDWTQAA